MNLPIHFILVLLVKESQDLPPRPHNSTWHGAMALNALWNPKVHYHNHKTTNLDIKST